MSNEYTLYVGDEDATEAFRNKLAQDPRVKKAYAEWQREEKSRNRKPFKVTKDITVEKTASARMAFEENVAQRKLISTINRRAPEESVRALVSQFQAGLKVPRRRRLRRARHRVSLNFSRLMNGRSLSLSAFQFR
ncbi:hypothetical protein [Neorhizobium tomejilense]|uniref:hypothetical protein n=1 Tax=Neorhizobium tomejilense TaxID=2093828 RepID=UPI003ECEC7D1